MYGGCDAGIDNRLNIPGTCSYFSYLMVARTIYLHSHSFFFVIIIMVLAVSSSRLVFFVLVGCIDCVSLSGSIEFRDPAVLHLIIIA